ncbi:hypothetical protein BJ684DRAFT_19376 [Piptocephalis cylindrospora]|uniref:Endonuclease/exonuclease/phosphatase n=1 Tax=Piptocephalis cylindrospora TaxID=1907219 RepID=A0A4P9Y607_9FUNG|nr:hypothetical protein BJ684DRAFT_19376 [Piptocephalis cylindrospora]|eukprot:RKP14202.1 hypothetical protein BJ684DRAFT_19376 [Piptocephalis cylindrospora]
MPETIRVGSFNVQALSIKKARNPEVSALLARIILRYDVCLLMEVRDASGLVVEAILQLLAQASLDHTAPVQGIASTSQISQASLDHPTRGVASTSQLSRVSLESAGKGNVLTPNGFKAINRLYKKLEVKFNLGSSNSRTNLTNMNAKRRRHQINRSVSQVKARGREITQGSPLVRKPSKTKAKSKARSRAAAQSRAVRDDDSYVEEEEKEEEEVSMEEGTGDENKENEVKLKVKAKAKSKTTPKSKVASKSKTKGKARKQEVDIPLIPEADLPYLAVASEPLGTGTHKERYIWVYNRNILRPLASKVYASKDVYARPPFAVKFEFTQTPGSSITLAGLHTQPTRSVEELEALHGINTRIVQEQGCTPDNDGELLQRHPPAPAIRQSKAPAISSGSKKGKGGAKTSVSGLTKLLRALSVCVPCIPRPPKPVPPTEDQPPVEPHPPPLPPKEPVHLGPILMGDFNAGFNYVPRKARPNMKLFTDPKYVWGIPDEADTTVRASSNQAYDRILWPKHQGAYFHGTDVWMFEREWDIPEEQALKVSDHYPVSVEVYVP